MILRDAQILSQQAAFINRQNRQKSQLQILGSNHGYISGGITSSARKTSQKPNPASGTI